ncbi:General transcription factor II-I repeat domain-containing protein 2B [Merluccius polli]|uniref:General transcription factor II-I repeat domain-containing protein 2B n=1 Tax=Merluccius polli TaxID=89951 RepID=A0AA47NQG7_MERPO|nr:General transcription factor II-I repeat domain-containing protein 2B [Merluccius polli]
MDMEQQQQKVKELKQKQAFANISLSQKTVASRVDELASDLQIQLKTKAKEFVSYLLAADERTFGFKGIHGTTTGQDIFTQVERCINETALQWNTFVGLTTDGPPVMCGEVHALVSLVREEMGHTGGNLTAYSCIIHQKALCGKVLGMVTVVMKTFCEDCYDTQVEIVHFMESKQKVIPKLDEKWLSDLACRSKSNLNLFTNPFAIDIDTAPEHLKLELIELQCNSALKTQ